MLIAHVLRDKGAAVHTLPADTTLEFAASELHRRKVGALVVVDDKRAIIGVLSERDIVREVGLRGAACLGDSAGAVMSRGVITASVDETIDDCLSRMTGRRVRHLPVVDAAGALIGIVSIGDLVKHRIAAADAQAAAMQAYISAN